MMYEKTSHITLGDFSDGAHLCACSPVMWNFRRGFVVSRSVLLSNLADMPWWYSQARNRRCRKQKARISPKRPEKLVLG